MHKDQSRIIWIHFSFVVCDRWAVRKKAWHIINWNTKRVEMRM
jgi:hypothetical protein